MTRSSPVQQPSPRRSARVRSAVSNGTKLLHGVDGGSALGRRYRDLVEGLTADLGGQLSEAEALLVRNAAALQLHSEDLTARLARGESVDPEVFTRATNGANRALTAIRKRRASPSAKRSHSARLAAIRDRHAAE